MNLLTFKRCSIFLVIAAGAGVVGCNSNDTVDPELSLTGRAALGPVIGATCTAVDAGGNLIARATQITDATGVFTFPRLPAKRFPVVVTCTGGNFYDEATNTTVPNTAAIQAVVPADRGRVTGSQQATVALTPLTSAAAGAFLALPAEQRTNSAANSANTRMASALAPGLDILTPPTPISTSNQTLGATPADQYAALLASFSYVWRARGGSTSDAATALINGLRNDSADGTIDGRAGTTPISNAGYTSFANLVSGIQSGTQMYEDANPNALAATNAVQANERLRGSANVKPSTTGS